MRKYDCKRVISNLYRILEPQDCNKIGGANSSLCLFLQEHLHGFTQYIFFFFLFSSSMWKSSSNLKVCQKLSWASLSLWASVNITFVRLTNYKVNFSDD